MRLVLPLLMILWLVGCVQPVYVTPASTPFFTPTPIPVSDEYIPSDKPPIEGEIDKQWICPGIIEVGNYYPGAIATWELWIHNGKDIPVQYQVAYKAPYHPKEEIITQEEKVNKGQIIYTFTLQKPLLNGDLKEVNWIVSNNANDNMMTIVSYDPTNWKLKVGGLNINESRTLTLNYVWDRYSAPPEKTGDWLLISESTPIIGAQSTRLVLVSLMMPKGETAPDKWELSISVSEITNATIQTEMRAQTLIKMRK